MRRTIGVIGTAALMLAAVPAQAASEAFVAGAAAFTDGKASDTRPQEQAEWAYCGGYWNVWGDAVAEEAISDDDLAVLSPVLGPLSAPFQALGIFTKLKESDTLNAEVDEGRVEARKFLQEALAGDVSSAEVLFGTLGACSL